MDGEELDLGIIDNEDKSICAPCCTEKPSHEHEKKPSYPTLSFRDKHADLFKDKYGPCATDDEYEVTVKLRIKKFSDGPECYDKCIEFDVVAIIGDVVEESGEDKAEEEKPEKPARGLAKAKKPAPKEEAAATY